MEATKFASSAWAWTRGAEGCSASTSFMNPSVTEVVRL